MHILRHHRVKTLLVPDKVFTLRDRWTEREQVSESREGGTSHPGSESDVICHASVEKSAGTIDRASVSK